MRFNIRCAFGIVLGALLTGGPVRADEQSLTAEFTVRRWAVEDGLPETEITAIWQGSDGFLWCVTPRHVVRFDGVQFVEARPPTGLAPQTVSALPTGIVLPASLAGEKPTAVLTDNTGATWVGLAHGLYRWNAGLWQSLTPRDGVVYPVNVMCLALDQEGNVWAGTTGGLIRLRHAPVRVFRTRLPWGNETITALLAESPTNFLVAVAGGGLVAGSPAMLQLIHIDGLPETTTISSLLRRRDGTLWIGTQGEGLWQYRPGHRAEPVGKVRGVCAILEDRHDRLWVGTWDGLMRLDNANLLSFVSGSPRNTVEELVEDSTGRIWVGYQSAGLQEFEQDGQNRVFSCGSVRALLGDATGDLWVGTTSGLEWWHGTRHDRFTTANGLVDDSILQILQDQAGFLWFGTRHGLMRVKKDEFQKIVVGSKKILPARVFGLEAGMANEECTGDLGTAAVQTSDGRLWFPTMEGIAMIDSRTMSHLPKGPRVYLEALSVNDQTLPLQNNATLRLPSGQRNVAFRYTTPIFTAPGRARFRYQLVGHDSQLSWSTADRTVNYQQLPPGQYQFRVMARDRDSDWSEPACVSLTIPALFWETIWFRLLVIGAACSGSAFVMRVYYKRRALRQLQVQERRHAVELERARIARDIHDDIGAGLTEMALLTDLARTEPGGDYLDRIFRRSRELTQSLNEIVWAINPRNDTLEGLLSYLAEFAQGFLAVAGIACRLDLPRDPPNFALTPNIRHHFCLAMKEALNNAVKHAKATEIHLRVEILRHELSLTITDNGTGVIGAVRLGFDGLENLQTRMREVGGTMQLSSVPGRGTRIVLTIQVPKI